MANTITGMTYENVARMGIQAYADKLAPLSAFTMDLSADAADQGTVVKTRIVPVAGTVGDLTDTHTGDYTDAIDDQAMSEVSVTMGSEPVIGFTFTDAEANQIASGVFSDTVQKLVNQSAYAIANNVLDTCFTAVDTTYSAGVSAVAASAFDADDVADLRAYCVTTGAWDFGVGDEKLICDSSYYTALLKDNALQDRSASGLDAVLSGNVPRCCGFDVIEAPSLAGAAANNTGAFAAKPEGMAVAMRGVATQSSTDFIAHEVLQDDVSDVVLTYKAWFDRTYHRVIHTFETLWGRADGHVNGIIRVTSA